MQVQNRIRHCDKFGAPVLLNFKGRDSFGTLGGGVASVLIYALILVFFLKQIIQLINHEDPMLSST